MQTLRRRKQRAALRLIVAAVVAGAAHAPAGCGGGSRVPQGVVQGATAADREFLDEMAVLLETAREFTGQAIGQAARAELKEYARKIHDEHARQVSAVRSLDQALFGHDPVGFGGIPQQIPPGPTFDRDWLSSMIELHRRAVDVASARLEKRGDAQAEALARQLEASERQELERLRAWAKQWFG